MEEAFKRKFVCSWPECRRSFGKAEHLQRHQRGHTGDARHECPICQKRFIRRDVMTRHAALHGEAVGLVKKTRKVSCKACAASKLRCDGAPGTTCRRCLHTSQPCLYISRDRTPQNPLTLDQFGESRMESTLETGSSRPFLPENSAVSTEPGARQTSVACVDPPQPTLRTNCAPLEGSAVGRFQSQAPDGVDFSLDRLYDFSTDPFESYMGWSYSGEEINIFTDSNEFSPVIPPACWPSLSTPMHSPAHSAQRAVHDASYITLIRDAQPADSPWPHVYKPSRDDEQLSIIEVDPCSTLQPIFQWECPDHVDISTREAILSVINRAHQPHWPTVDVSAFPSTRTLSTCINFYFQHFHETLPILCRSSFQSGEHSPVLLLAMAAIGAMYSPKRMTRLAVGLNELCRRAIVYLRESDRHLMFDTSIVQAWLLQSIFGLFCGSRLLYHHAEVSRGGLVTAARRMHLLRPAFSFVKELEQHGGTASTDELEKARMKDEERCRLGWGVYLYDMQISALLNISPHFSVGEVDISLPWNEDVWESRSPHTHDDSAQPSSGTLNFRQVLEDLLSVGKLPQTLSPFALSIIAHTLHRLCSDAASLDSLCVAQPVDNPSFYRLPFPANIKHNPQRLLDQLSVYFHSLSLPPTPSLLSVSALSHLGHLQFTWTGFLDKVKIAAGKSGTEESKLNARSWLSSKISDDVVGARSILVHAGRLNALLIRFPFDNPCETLWMFYAALALWAIIKFGSDLNISSSGSKRTVVTWSEFDNADEWIQHGGQVFFQGLGNLADLPISKLLSTFYERLEFMSWGVSVQFRHVLLDLAKETA
ncbi:hypothetical protein ASPCAL03728 [Aspergillus calidoustus]|uniref:C2H2-type domain-containing protein n=1 Tax=Aspergillus calidoustus TaxID=454130 RepID=A0A0U5FSS8_ASPCI|nr:hypothetical protein ASPCAL03728 [Aspergillus calidoustus]